jgi:hypothetical protein
LSNQNQLTLQTVTGADDGAAPSSRFSPSASRSSKSATSGRSSGRVASLDLAGDWTYSRDQQDNNNAFETAHGRSGTSRVPGPSPACRDGI